MKLLHGDCLEQLKHLDDNSIDCVCTDPPYGLDFMGKQWDHGVPGEAFWREILRVAKPGAWLTAFGGTRTHHRLMIAIEDAGWDIRDCMMLFWCFGTGFPKSYDVAKALDRQAGRDTDVEREIAEYVRAHREELGFTFEEIDRHVFKREVAAYVEGKANETGGYDQYLPTPDEWQRLKRVLKLDDRYDQYVALLPDSGDPNDRSRYINVTVASFGYQQDGGRMEYDFVRTAPVTELARKYEGYGTALKPAYEPIVLAQAPFGGTIADNIKRWGTGALNIDASRVPATGRVRMLAVPTSMGGTENDIFDMGSGVAAGTTDEGRWPANVMASHTLFCTEQECAPDCPVRQFPQAAGRDTEPEQGADRYFPRFHYCGKASRKERGRNNRHPTVKPRSVVNWLLRLTAPPGRPVVLDPFMGSGTTGVAASLLGMDFVGVEREAEYFDLAQRRVAFASWRR